MKGVGVGVSEAVGRFLVSPLKSCGSCVLVVSQASFIECTEGAVC